MLVLNSLPNVQMLNGRSTKDEEEEEEGDDYDNDEIENQRMQNENINIKDMYKNNFKNNHLYPQMEEIEEDKNLENNYVSEENNPNINVIDNNNIQNYNSNGENNENQKETKTDEKNMNINDNQIMETESKRESKPINEQDIYINISERSEQREEKEKEKEEKKENIEIDITDEELEMLTEERYSEKSDFIPFMKEICDFLNNYEENEDGERLQNNYISKIQTIEEKKNSLPNYYYFYLLYKKKIKILQNMYSEMIPYIRNKCPEINKDEILDRLNNELFNTIKDAKELIGLLHSHIGEYIEYIINDKDNKKDNNKDYENKINEIIKEKDNKINEINNIIKEKDNKISSLEKLRDQLIQSNKEEKKAYEQKIATLENENKIMTEKILKKADNIVNSSLVDDSVPVTDINIINNSGPKNINNNNKKNRYNNESLTNRSNASKTKSPYKYMDNNTYDNNNTIFINNYLNTNTYDYNISTLNNCLNTNNEFSINKPQIIALKTLKDFINELYLSKAQYDIKCRQLKIPKETLEEHMYTFLNKKYGLKNLIIEWVKNIINGIKAYSKKDSIVLLFGKIIKNEQEEDARLIIQKVSESIEELLLYYIKRQNPLKPLNEIKKIFEQKKKSFLFEEEWKGIIYSIYEKNEADIIQQKIDNYINKENEKKKLDMFNKYKKTRVNKNRYDINYCIENNIYNNYLNTINSFNEKTYNNIMNTNSSYLNLNGNAHNNNNNINKLSRIEKYNILLFPDEKNIPYNVFIKIVLDNHIRFRDKQLKNFVTLFKSVDTNKDGIINEEEFNELIEKMNIFKEDEVQNKIFEFLEKLDPFDNQKFTFSDCISFFSNEYIKDVDTNGNEKEISILEKICFNEYKDENGEMIYSDRNKNYSSENK